MLFDTSFDLAIIEHDLSQTSPLLILPMCEPLLS